MRCPFPLKLVNPETKRPLIVPCGQCAVCRINRALEWSFRLLVEKHSNPDCVFLTLTYSDDSLPVNSSLDPKQLCDFWKRFRARGYHIRYFAAGEYGTKSHRPHYHAIVFGITFENFLKLGTFTYDPRCRGYYGIIDLWPFGNVYLGDVTSKSICYVCKYTLKSVKGKGAVERYDNLGLVRPFSRMSRRPAIGFDIDFAIKQNPKHLKRIDLHHLPIPRYYRDKLFPKGSFERAMIDDQNFVRMIDLYSESLDQAREAGVDIAQLSTQALLDVEHKLELFHDREGV